MANWFILKSDKEHGPFTAQQLKSLAESGKLKPDDQIRRDDKKKVYRATEVKGLFGVSIAGSGADGTSTLVITRRSKLTGFLSPVSVLLDGTPHGSLGGGFPGGVLDLLASRETSISIPISGGQHQIEVTGGGLNGSTTVDVRQGQTHRLRTYFSNMGKMGGGLRLESMDGPGTIPAVSAEAPQSTKRGWTTKGAVKLGAVFLGLFIVCSGAMRGCIQSENVTRHQESALTQSGRDDRQIDGTRMTVTGVVIVAFEGDPVEVRMKTTISDVGLPSGRPSIQKFVLDQMKTVGRSVTCHTQLDEWRQVEKTGIVSVEGSVSEAGESSGRLVLIDCHVVAATPANRVVSLRDHQYFRGFRNGVETGLEKRRQYERETDPRIKVMMRDDLIQLVLHYHRQAQQMLSAGGQADVLAGLGDGLRSGFHD